MIFDSPLVQGRLIRRYKRFLADVILPNSSEAAYWAVKASALLADGHALSSLPLPLDHTVLTAHCPNSGSMQGLCAAGNRVALQKSDAPARKYPYTLEMIQVSHCADHESDNALLGEIKETCWIGINTHASNKIVAAALAGKLIPELSLYQSVRAEVSYDINSRCDFLLSESSSHEVPELCFVEVKTVHMSRKSGIAEFPDARTERGTKHAEALARQSLAGMRAVLLYLVLRDDCHTVDLARDIDPVYAQAVDCARSQGLEVLAYGCRVTPENMAVMGRLALAF